jgi:hypothetical protein
LWLLFAGTVALTVLFRLISEHWNMTFLDAIASPEEARAHLSSLSAEQVRVHIWTTAIVDVLYPIFYGGLFAGVALSSFRHFGLLLAIPSFLVIPVDIAEGVVQIYALLGTGDWLAAKAILTPLKFILFFMGFAIAAYAWGHWLIRRFRGATP